MKHAIAFALLASAVVLAGCGASAEHRSYEYMPDMARGPAYKAFAPNGATRDGLTLQRPVSGTIPRGYMPFHYGPGEQEAERAGRELHNPYRPTSVTLEEGHALFQTYCQVCHGEQGKGDGPISSIASCSSLPGESFTSLRWGQTRCLPTPGSSKPMNGGRS